MEPVGASDSQVRAKRGCLWYFGVAVIGLVGLLVLFTTLVLNSPDAPQQSSILASAREQTYLEAVTEDHAEGFLDPYTTLGIYYTRLGSWFQSSQRVKVYCGQHGSSAYGISFRRIIDSYGQIRIEVKRPKTDDEIRTAVTQEVIGQAAFQQLRGGPNPLNQAFMSALEARVQAKIAAKDSLLFTVFVPPAIFPEKEAELRSPYHSCP